MRAYGITQGRWIGPDHPPLPPDITATVMRYPEVLENLGTLKASEVAADAIHGTPLPAVPAVLQEQPNHYWLFRGIRSSNIYCPIAYLPAAFGIAIGRILGLSALGLLYAGRFADALAFVVACFIAFRLAPNHMLLIGAVALLPMTLVQAGGLTADTMMFAVSIVAVASLLWLRENSPSRRSLVAIALLFALWAACKISPWTFVALLLIPRRLFASTRSWLGYLVATAAGMILVIALWQYAAAASFQAISDGRAADGIDMAARVRSIRTHPIQFAASATAFALRNSRTFLADFVGAFGWMRWRLRFWVHPLILLLLVIVALTEVGGTPFTLMERLTLIAVFLAGVATIHVILYVSDGFDGIQGRYFTPFSLFGLLALRQSKYRISHTTLTVIVLAASLIHGAVSLLAISRRYYS